MRDMARENGEQFALLPYKEEIGTLAQSLKGVLGADVIVVDKYLNRIVNTFHYRYNSADIRINSVVGNIVTTQKLQMTYDRKYFTDCVNCPDYTTCELGGVFGTPIMCGGECIGAIALLVEPNQVVSFQQKQTPVIDFLQQISILISEMVRSASNSRLLQAVRTKFRVVLDSVNVAAAITDSSGVVFFANRYFMDFFSDGQAVVGSRIDEIFTRWKLQAPPEGEKRSLIDNSFYKKGPEVLHLRGIQSMAVGEEGPLFLYIFDKVDALPFLRYQTQTTYSPELVDQFFGRSPAMERAKLNTQRAMRNQLSILVECPDRRQADALARLLFMRSIQDNYQIVKVDCSEDERILETVLLDREEGSPGVLFLSQESVVYLYGIDHLPMYLQNKLAKSLRGSWDDEAPAHVRVIATSGRNLYAQVKKDRFSMELYNMISRNKISIPQVSGVPEDIRFYFEKYLERYCGIYGQPPIRVGGEAWSFLERRRWEGGVQEIRETAERIVIRAEGEELGLEELAAFFPEESLRPQNRGIVEDSIESQLRRLLGAGMTKEKIAEEMGVSRATLYRWIEKFKLNESALRERESAG